MEDNSEINTGSYWSERYQEKNIPWDIGTVSPPLTAFLQGLRNKEQRILIPGAGNGYEAEWLWKNGFKNTFVVDIASDPLKNIQKRVPGFPENQLIPEDFFAHHQHYDLIIEQTFFCALPPVLRKNYVQKMNSLLAEGAQLFGVLFDFPLTEAGPPFGGSREEYRKLFSEYFKVHKLERCYNSIPPRQGNELFFRVIKKS